MGTVTTIGRELIWEWARKSALRGHSGGVADDGGHAVVIEPDGNASGGQEDRHAVPLDESTNMIDLKTTTADELDREWPKGVALHEGIEQLLEVVGCHARILCRGRHVSKLSLGASDSFPS